MQVKDVYENHHNKCIEFSYFMEMLKGRSYRGACDGHVGH